MSDKPASLMSVPEGYDHWLGELKVRISTAQQHAARAVNRELVLLYWQSGLLAGCFICARGACTIALVPPT